MGLTSIPDEALSRTVRVYAVANLHTGRIHGMTCNINQSRAWVRELCDTYGPDAAVQCVDLVDPEEQSIPLEDTTMTATPDNRFEELLSSLGQDRAALSALTERRPGLYTTSEIVTNFTDLGVSRATAEAEGRKLDEHKATIRDATLQIDTALTEIRAMFLRGMRLAEDRRR